MTKLVISALLNEDVIAFCIATAISILALIKYEELELQIENENSLSDFLN